MDDGLGNKQDKYRFDAYYDLWEDDKNNISSYIVLLILFLLIISSIFGAYQFFMIYILN